MAKLKLNDPRFLKSFAYRGQPRGYGTSELAGMTAVLAEVKDGRVKVVTTDINTVYVDNIDDESFFWAYEPALDVGVGEAALELRSCMRSWIRPKTSEAPQLIERVIENPTEEPAMETPTKQQLAARKAAMVYKDHQQRTALAINEEDGKIYFVPLESHGLEIVVQSTGDFRRNYTPVATYPVERAALLYAGYSQHLGGTPEAMAALAKLINITQKEIDMATSKKAENPVESKPKTTKTKPAAETTPAPAKGKGKTAEPKDKEPKAPRESAASLFRSLLLETDKSGKTCKHTDDEIFATVQEKFGLDDKKRSYVAWYRNNLAKAGETVPAKREG